jgi:Cupin-like domain
MNSNVNPAEPTSAGVQPADPARPGTGVSAASAYGSQDVSIGGVPSTPSATQPAATPRLSVNDQWRRWIAENLMIGQRTESILGTMMSAGFGSEEAAHEIKTAQESPYLKGAELLRNRLRKRDWLLAVYRENNRMHPHSGTIERRHRLSRSEFLREFYVANRPVVITGMIDDWPALRKWSLDFFAQAFGEREVEVQMGRTASADYEINREKYVSRSRFGDFVEKVRMAGETNDFYLTANNTSFNRKALSELWDDIVQIPEYLAYNRLGGYFWMGPKGTITPFHHDLTNNFMAQVIGCKRVKIVPSWDIPFMRNHLHCYSQVDGRITPSGPRPPRDAPQIYELILNPGEVLFLPIGCMHYVQGIDISVTVSFTNFVFNNDYVSFYNTYGPV